MANEKMCGSWSKVNTLMNNKYEHNRLTDAFKLYDKKVLQVQQHYTYGTETATAASIYLISNLYQTICVLHPYNWYCSVWSPYNCPYNITHRRPSVLLRWRYGSLAWNYHENSVTILYRCPITYSCSNLYKKKPALRMKMDPSWLMLEKVRSTIKVK